MTDNLRAALRRLATLVAGVAVLVGLGAALGLGTTAAVAAPVAGATVVVTADEPHAGHGELVLAAPGPEGPQGPNGTGGDVTVQFDDLTQCEVSHQANRR